MFLFHLVFAAYTFDGLLVFGLLLICTCAYMRRVPRLKQWFLSEKKGFFGVFYKASVIGTRLHLLVSLTCVAAGFYLLFVK
uniref:Protein kish n=1 Tax=Ixodes scapularis TaxID=6945 RepID=A0A4D5RY17_IXOSC